MSDHIRTIRLAALLLGLLVLFGAGSPAPALAAPERTALVIGNGDYENSPLDNPVNDAEAMAKALAEVGFKVTKLVNQDQTGMKKAIDQFGKGLSKGGVALFYFAGHGMQVSGFNYLIPVKTGIRAEEDVEYEAVRADRVMAKMESAGTAVNIVILDACRNNPFARSFRSGSQGLAHMDAPSGTIIAYATAPGSTAADGEGQNGLYTSELIKHLREPGLTIEDVFKRVRSGVRGQSHNEQTPWESSSLTGNFYFKEGTAQTEAPAGPPAAAPAGADTPTGPRVVGQRALTGTVIVVSNVAGAVFNLAGREFETQAGAEITIDQVPAGPQTVTARKDGYSHWQSTITVEPNQTATLDIYMTEKGAAAGTTETPKAPGKQTAALPGVQPGPAAPETNGERDLSFVPEDEEDLMPGYKLARDSVLGFSVQVPQNWNVQNINDSGDQVIIALSPDQNVAFRVRGFQLGPGVNLNQIRAVFENLLQNSLLNHTGQLVRVQEDYLNDMDGQTAVYSGNLANGVPVGITAFFTIQADRGFILWTVIAANQFDARLPEVLTMAQTFDPGVD